MKYRIEEYTRGDGTMIFGVQKKEKWWHPWKACTFPTHMRGASANYWFDDYSAAYSALIAEKHDDFLRDAQRRKEESLRKTRYIYPV